MPDDPSLDPQSGATPTPAEEAPRSFREIAEAAYDAAEAAPEPAAQPEQETRVDEQGRTRDASGRFVLHAPYNLIGHGTYSISGSRIMLHGPGSACTTPGVYQFSLSGSYLTFHKISDHCPRAAVLTAHAMKRR